MFRGCEAQDAVGPLEEDDDPEIVGCRADGGRGAKGVAFLRRCAANRLALLNTFGEHRLGSHTCHYVLKREPKEVDYIGIAHARKHITSKTMDLSCGESDHTAVRATLLPKGRLPNPRRQAR
jgi:hypothetical protein